MIQLSNIRFESLYPQKQIKHIQFSLISQYLEIESNIFKSKSTPMLINDMTLEWNELIKIPLNFDESIKFQLISPQQIILNDQDKTSIFGQFLVKKREKITCDVFYKQNEKKLKVGSLYMNVIIKENQMPFIQKIKPEPFSPKVQASILVKNLAKVPQKGCIVIDNGKRKLKSPLVSPTNSEKKQFYYLLRFRESFLKDCKNKLIIFFYNEESIFLGKSIFKFTEKQKNMKEWLINELLVRVGDIYLNIFKKVQYQKDQKQVSTLKKRSGSQQALSSNLSSRKYSKQTILQSKFTYAISKKMSHAGFSNEQKLKKQKGAYIGYGNRHDFTDRWKGNPGVGQYKLPSIF